MNPHRRDNGKPEDTRPAPNKKKKRPIWRKRIWGVLPSVFLVCLAAVIGLLFDRIQSKGEVLQERKKAAVRPVAKINVVTLAVVPAPIRDRISLPGTTEPWIRLTVVAEVRGRVVAKSVTEGQKVQKGQILAELDPRDYQNAYRSAKASYETAKASLERLQKLQEGQLSTRSQLDDAKALVENTRAAMDTAALNLERCTIRSHMAGEINRVPVEEGQYLDVGETVAEIIQMERLKVKVGIPESDVDAVRRVQSFDVTIDALGGRVFKAEKRFLSNTADALARLYMLELSVENPDRAILPDMFARVEIVKQTVTAGLSVPLYAVINRNDQNLVFVVEDGAARSRPVKLGLQEGWRVEIRQGLEAGDRVIVVGHRGVSDDQAVTVVRSVERIRDLQS